MVRGTQNFLALLLAAAAGPAGAAALNPATVKAWDQYVGSARAQMKARLGPSSCFLWAEEDAGRMARLRSGEIVVSPDDPETPRHIPGGLIHHWIGAAFIPNATLSQLLATVRNYGSYPKYYPSVTASKLLARDGSVDHFRSLELHQAMFSTRIAMDADFDAEYLPAGEKRAYSIASTTRLQQVQDYGASDQHELEPMAPTAYLWALTTISRYEEKDGGVYLELEAMALSRDVPFALRWLVDPFVRKASVTTLYGSLKQTREAVIAERKRPGEPLPVISLLN